MPRELVGSSLESQPVFCFFQEESHDPDIQTQIYFCAMLILPIIIFVAGKITFFVGETVRIG